MSTPNQPSPDHTVGRRTFLQLLAGVTGLWGSVRSYAASIPDSTLAVDRLMSAPQTQSNRHARRLYRADAVITLFNIPIFSRAGVGGGFAVYDETTDHEGRRVSLQFAGGSRPDRAKGLNRLGYIHEVVLERNSAPAEAAYFGFMTSSPEENLDEAKKALEASNGMLPYTAVDGSTGPGRMRSSNARFLFPPSYNWSNNDSLIREVRTKFPKESRVPVEARLTAAGVPWTFLYTVAQAASTSSAKSEWSYVYNGKQYKLRTEKNSDLKAGKKLVEKGLATKSENVWRLSGVITGPDKGPETPFKVWMEQAPQSMLPLRIEFQARSFLRLVFEFDPALEAAAQKKEPA
ncbi:MAG: hypothetical protein ABI693_19420 [Bryobacteraceae bacterium]